MDLGSKKEWINNLIILIISVILVCLFFILNKNNFTDLIGDGKNSTIIKNSFNIDAEIKNYRDNYDVLNINKINDSLTSILFKDNNVLKSVTINNYDGKVINPLDMFKQNELSEAQSKINELLLLKYPRFIVEGINNFPGDIIYEFKNNELVIYYNNFVFNPTYNKEILLHVNYNEIDDYLNFNHQLDDEYENEDGYKLDPNKITVAISFDDGPSWDKTEKILKALEDNKMSATFFMAGYKMVNQRDMVKKVLASHSEAGSHTYNHINMKKVKADRVDDELSRTNSLYKEISGFDFKLVRPPYGAYTDDIIKKYNYSFILWNVDTNDWRYKDVDYLVNHIINNIEDGNIILMHDSYDTSVETVEKVLPYLYSKDIQVVSVSKLAELKGITLEPGKAYNYLK